jgi:hypothetical protein
MSQFDAFPAIKWPIMLAVGVAQMEQTFAYLPFSHRQNWNGTYDSICRKCYKTVATANNEVELEHLERRHVCFPLWKAERDMPSRMA